MATGQLFLFFHWQGLINLVSIKSFELLELEFNAARLWARKKVSMDV